MKLEDVPVYAIGYHYPGRPANSCRLLIRAETPAAAVGLIGATRPTVEGIDSFDQYIGPDHETILRTPYVREVFGR